MWRYLTEEEIRDILSSRSATELIGEAALNRGYLTRFQLQAVIGFQKWLQRPIGEYFIHEGILEADDLDILARLLAKHNREVERDLGARG